MEKRQTRREEAAQLIGSWSLWQIGSKTWVKNFLTWQGLCRLRHTCIHTQMHKPTQIVPDTRPCAVTFYLSILFIIVWQCKRQTGKGYDVSSQEFVVPKWSGIMSSSGHFSCGVCDCVYILCVFWTLFQAKTAINMVIVLSWF